MGEAYDADLGVVGSGGAAMAAGITAREHGASVVLVETGTLGGTCVNVGCVPSKTLLVAAGARHTALANPFPGAPTSAGDVDLAALTRQKDDLVAGLRKAKYVDVAGAHGIELRRGYARFADPDTLLLDDRSLRARAFVIATGVEPARPDLPGLDDVDWLTSTTAAQLDELPESLVVVGGGFVGVEQAQLFAHLGSRVTLVGHLAPHAEPEVVARLAGVLGDDGIDHLPERAARVDRDGGVRVTTASGRQVTGQRLLVATGRSPRTATLDPPAAGVDLDASGFVTVDEHQRTTNPRVYAAGDVTGAPQFVYVAAATGRVAATNALGAAEPPATVDWHGLPAVIFTRPQLAFAGLTEAGARAAGHSVDVQTLDLADVPRALANHDTRGAVKLVADAATGRLLGVHALADGAGEMMLAATYAIKAGMTLDDLADTWAPYLTMAECLRLTARLYRSKTPTSCCA